MNKPKKLNKTQIQAIANLLLEIGKWLLLSVVFGSLLVERSKAIEPRDIIIALILALVLIIIAIWMLKEVKDK